MNRFLLLFIVASVGLTISPLVEGRDVLIPVRVKGSVKSSAAVSRVSSTYKGTNGSDSVSGKSSGAKTGSRATGVYTITLKSTTSSSAGSRNYVDRGRGKLSRRSIKNDELGKIRLSKPISPTKRGKQKVKGRGIVIVNVP